MDAIPIQRDLLVLVADADTEAALKGIISRPKSLGIRPIQADVKRHLERDCGCRASGVEYLNSFRNQYRHALLIFDLKGCGAENQTRDQLESELEHKLNISGWGGRAAVIVINPELENWIWSDSPHVGKTLGWEKTGASIKEWLSQKNLWPDGCHKPPDPKEAFMKVLREAKKPRSSSLYQTLAEKVSFTRCSDEAFRKFINTMKKWFGDEKG